jgi:hypothetical protein
MKEVKKGPEEEIVRNERKKEVKTEGERNRELKEGGKEGNEDKPKEVKERNTYVAQECCVMFYFLFRSSYT